MQKLKVLFTLIILSSFIFSDNKSIVTQSANVVINVFEGVSSVRHLTPYMADIARNGHLLPEDTKIKLKSLGFDFSGETVLSPRPTYLELNYDSENFRIHYTLTGNNAVDPTISYGNTAPDYIETIAEVFEQVYYHDINERGYTPPPSDGIEGGSNDIYDIYVISTNAYGWTDYGTKIGDNPNSSENENNVYLSFITLRNNYDGFPNTELENIQVTAAHEFFHAIQLGYDGDEARWLMEATAVWMEEEHYDDVNDCYQYMVKWFEKPHISLSFSNYWQEYGSYIFFKYIDEHLGGSEIIKNTWEQSRIFDSSIDKYRIQYSIQAVDLALKSVNHSFKKALNNMAIANCILSSDNSAGQYSYEEAIGYHNYRKESYNDTLSIQLGIYDSIDFINGVRDTIQSYNLQKYGSQYVKINTNDPVKISINKPDLTLHTIAKSFTGNYEVQSGNVLNIDPGSNTEWIYAVVVADDEGSDYSYNLSFTDGTQTNYTDFTIVSQFPNPFNSSITIKLKVITPQNIDINVYDMLGRKINTIYSGYLSDGSYEYLWNGVNANNEKVSSGVYYITAVSDSRQEWKKITLIK
ncbi:T9SS type A sorting domain-containing protein [bacterium]|nr:T9SS type A sorting domain-containing protein [bacterium]